MSFAQSLRIASVKVHPIRAAGGVSPNMALGLMTTRPALLVSVTNSHGCTGWGEVWANFPPRANIHKAHLIEDVVAPRLTDRWFVEPLEIGTFLRDALATYFLHIGQLRVFEHILAGLDIALWDLALRSAGRSFSKQMGLRKVSAASYASSINPPDLEDLMAQHASQGQRHFKLKLGFDDDADCAFVEMAAKLCPEGSRIMVDNNQTWDLPRAKNMLARLEDYDPLFSEEPIPANAGLDAWEELAKSTRIPLAGGENLYGVEEFLRMANAGVRYLQPDVAKWGGISGALELAGKLPSGVSLWPHFMGTAVGQMAALSVAAAVGEASVCEMDVNENALRSDLCGDTLTVSDGRVALPDASGLVASPLADKLAGLRENGF